MSERPTYEQVVEIQKAILLGKPVPPGFPKTEAALRREIAEIVDAGGAPDVPGD
jgi:hypothetical protein